MERNLVMLDKVYLLAQRRNEAANAWLEEHPMVLGLGALALGALIGGWGIKDLMSGTARDKYGNELEGGMAMTMGIIRLVAGGGLCLFGIYKMVAG